MADDEFYEEDVYSDVAGEEEEDSLVEDDEMTAIEEGFLKGYEEADTPKRRRKAEAEEEELE